MKEVRLGCRLHGHALREDGEAGKGLTHPSPVKEPKPRAGGFSRRRRNALDVDLAASTRTCVRELWPRLRSGGVLFSLDGQLRATHEILGDTRFWRDEVGVEPPVVGGLEYEKLLALRRS